MGIQRGIKLNIGDGGASLEVGAGHASMSASITGNSSIAVSADIERVSVTLSNEIDWKTIPTANIISIFFALGR